MIKKLFKELFQDSMIGSIGVMTIIILSGLIYLVPQLSKEQSKKDAYEESQRLVTYIKMFRAYYNSDVLSKIKKHTDLKVNFDHKDNDKTVPLPATLVHDMGEIFTNGTDIGVEMYSNFPFPNRKDRVLDKFQKDSLAFVLKNPDKEFSREEIVNGELMLRTSFADFLSADSCVNCHNTRLDTPKDTWQLGDIRGVIEVDVPLKSSLGNAKDLTFNIVLFILLNFAILIINYYFYMRRKNKKLQDKYTNKDKILSEYKKAVDLGAIVSKADTHGNITYVNDAFCEISGYSQAELIGNPHSMIRHPDTDKEVFKEMWSKITQKEVWQGDIKNLGKNGKDYYVYATIVPIVDEHDAIVEYLAIRYDTTTLNQAVKDAHAAERTKSRFLANMSHELRTPLNAIIGFSQILQRKGNLSQKDANYVEKIGISGQNLLALVNSILDFSKIEEGEMDFNPSDVNLKLLFEEILILFETNLNEKHITVSMFECTEDQHIFADKQLLKQAIINILSNAVKFTDKGGEIRLTYEMKDSLHTFSICDTGQGISKEDIKTLFEPFKQGESAQKNAAKGTGLGLAITKSIIKDLHKGDIWVESKLNEGTCFYFSL